LAFGRFSGRLVQFSVVMLNAFDNGSITPSNVAAMTEPTSPTISDRQTAALCELGVLGVERAGRRDAVRGRLTPMFLAALGLAGNGGVGSEELIETIWPSPDQPATARQSLANIVLRLRRSHGASFVESTRRGYRLGSHVQSDRQRFLMGIEQAGKMLSDAPDRALKLVDQAIGRWRGEPWAGIERPDGVEADRAHLLRMHTHAHQLRATALISLGRQESALPLLREMVVADPYDELSRHQLVRVLTETGQRAEAIGTVREAHRVFAERGLVVDASLVEAEQRLLSEQFAFDGTMEPLPEQPTEFFGREREIEEIVGRLQVGRLVTLHGIGGSGKTRLAIRVAVEISDAGESGFVDLAGTRSPEQVELAFARGLGLPTNRLDGLDSDERRTALASAASASSAILVVDNCEHVLHDVGDIVNRLLAQPGDFRMLATSRAPLEIAGENCYPIPEFASGPELFARRAALHGSRINSERHAHVVADICDLVDQLPLAIEIAAAQTPYRTVHEIADELRRGITQRDATQSAPRHETMAATIRWSHELLDPDVATAFIRLGIFRTPFQRSDAAAVTAPSDADGVLDTLVRSSLVERDELGERSAYRLAVPVQQYCAAELERSGDATDVGIALGEWLLDFTDRPDSDVWVRVSVIDEIEPRISHALTVIAALRAAGRSDEATALAGRIGEAARLYGRSGELLELLNELWPTCGDPEAKADALRAVALCAENERRTEMLSRALRLLAAFDRAAGRKHRAFAHCWSALWIMWTARLRDQNYRSAHDELQRAREGDAGPNSPTDRALIESWQGALHLLEGNWPAAETAARRSLEDSAGTLIDVDATLVLCHARLHRGDPETALEIATSHRYQNRLTTFGNRLEMVGAIARVQRGDVDVGLHKISQSHAEARRTPGALLQEDTSVVVAYVAHLLSHDDLTRRVLETGVIGRGPWFGHLVPKMCRDLGIPLTGHFPQNADERKRKSDHYGATASGALDELHQRHVNHSAPPYSRG
jgi:predicted ATPase/DNA-binding SARP family transcriptional activator